MAIVLLLAAAPGPARDPDLPVRFQGSLEAFLAENAQAPGRSAAGPVRVLAKGYTKTDWWNFQSAARWSARQMGVEV